MSHTQSAIEEAIKALIAQGFIPAFDVQPSPDRWETDWTEGEEPSCPAPTGYEWCGSWEPIGVGLHNTRVNGGVEDMIGVFGWRRPLRKIEVSK